MNHIKKLSFALFLALLCSNTANTANVAFAHTIDMTTINGLHAATRQAEVKDIIITEAAPGLFEKEKNIYLKSERLEFEGGAEAEITKGDIRIKEVKADGDILKITIKKASSQASEIKISNVKFYLDGSLADGSYDLELITEESAEYPDNIFGGFYQQSTKKGNHAASSITLIKDFVTISTTPRDKQQTPILYRDEITIPQAEMQNGMIMVPLRSVMENAYDTAVVTWDEETQTAVVHLGQRIGSITIGSNVMNLNGVSIPVTAPAEIKNGNVFVAVEDFACLAGISEKKIQYNPVTMTVTLN